jgi:hypothetical protein
MTDTVFGTTGAKKKTEPKITMARITTAFLRVCLTPTDGTRVSLLLSAKLIIADLLKETNWNI